MNKNIKQTKNINDENSDIQEEENIPINEINNSNVSSTKKKKNRCNLFYLLLIFLLLILILLIFLNKIIYLRHKKSIFILKNRLQVNENINNDTDINNNITEIENSVKIIKINDTKENESITKTILLYILLIL